MQTSSYHVTRRLIVASLFAVALAGCHREPTAPAADVVGRWELASVNGKALPYVLVPPSFAVHSASIDIGSDGYSAVTCYTAPPCMMSRPELGGTYTVAGRHVSLKASDGYSRDFTLLDANTMQAVNQGDFAGFTLTFRRTR